MIIVTYIVSNILKFRNGVTFWKILVKLYIALIVNVEKAALCNIVLLITMYVTMVVNRSGRRIRFQYLSP